MLNREILVLLIEDDPMVQEVNKQFVERVKGFKVVAVAKNGLEGIQKVKQFQPDLVLLDIFMPNIDGIEVLHEIRTEKIDIDVIIVTAANDRKTIRTVLQNGALDYIIKPFKFKRIQQALQNYQAYRKKFVSDDSLSQIQLDQMLFFKNANNEGKTLIHDLPKGLNNATLELIITFLKIQHEPKSTEEVADGVGLARVTAGRYLAYLKDIGTIKLAIQYGVVGRPVNKYIILQ